MTKHRRISLLACYIGIERNIVHIQKGLLKRWRYKICITPNTDAQVTKLFKLYKYYKYTLLFQLNLQLKQSGNCFLSLILYHGESRLHLPRPRYPRLALDVTLYYFSQWSPGQCHCRKHLQ